MGKIKVNGNAERLYDPDMFVLSLEIRERGDTAAEATGCMREAVEDLLAELEKIGITAEYIRMEEDAVDERSRSYSGSEEIYWYVSRRKLSIRMRPDMEIVNAVRRIIADEESDITMDIEYMVSDMEEIKKQLLKEAVADAKAKALLIAEAMDQKLVGIESADTGEGYFCVDDEMETARDVWKRAEISMNSKIERSDDIKAKQIRISSEINIVWLIG